MPICTDWKLETIARCNSYRAAKNASSEARMTTGKWQVLGVAVLLLAGCHQQGNEGSMQPAAAASTSTAGKAPGFNADQWIGRWNGPEGTYLSIAKSEGGYALEIADLDGPKPYAARTAGDHLVFDRNGKTESIRATDGKQTGMKWLQDKSNCLTINAGEGYCRD
ncbi:hypothetical protein [Nevskia ramosa]|uniref:hypothetical protein n=1 Tax=Nevskia ramosa TaxID=64002 RepID=UPI003D13F381